jgi:uncharacterized membrane protein (Fun14 family)
LVTDILILQAEQLLFTLGGSGLLGFILGFFLKKAVKIVMFVGGGIVALLAYLGWKNMISVNWQVISDEAWTTANSTLHAMNGMIHTVGDKIDAANTVSIGGIGIGFFGGFLFGIRKG